jgi:16S rRNA processing protein RimM
MRGFGGTVKKPNKSSTPSPVAFGDTLSPREREGAASTPDRVLLAKIGAAHGVKGETRVKVFGPDPMALHDYGVLSGADGRRFEVERIRPAKSVVIVKFRGVDDRDAAEVLSGTELFVERSALPAPEANEYYHADLLGLEAHDAAGDLVGTVVAIHNFGAGDILEIAPQRGPSLLLPFTDANVPAIDLSARRLVVAPPAETEIEKDEA